MTTFKITSSKAFPLPETMTSILKAIGAGEGLSITELLTQVNVSRSIAHRTLKLLEIDGAIEIKCPIDRHYY